MEFGFVGFGLIGGSIAKALKIAHPNCTITATTRTLSVLEPAKKDGVVDNIVPTVNESFNNCDYIFLCTPVITITQYLKQLKPFIKKSCIITDVGSVKGAIHKAVTQLDMEDNFIGGHPMAGSELTGYLNSSADIMINAKYVITPTKKTTQEQLQAYVQLVKDCKAYPVVMDYSLHDYTVAGISHVPHIISASLAKLVMDNDDNSHYMHLLAAGGFKDTTRIAASSPEMWDQICATNSDAICELLTKYIDLLANVRDNINNKTDGYVSDLFDTSRNYRNTF
jgi:prephenate dehydrogenase